LGKLKDTIWKSTPHARGSTLEIRLVCQFLDVYPACAGIHLTARLLSVVTSSLPRMRGDPPHYEW